MARAARVVPARPHVVVPRPPFATVDEAIADIRAGRMVVVVDDEDRENEGDLTLAAELCDADDVAFIRTHASGVICVPMTAERLEELDLPQMVARNEARLGTAFTVTVDAREGVTTGISAADRARTINVLADPNTGPADLVKPGHICQLRSRARGPRRAPRRIRRVRRPRVSRALREHRGRARGAHARRRRVGRARSGPRPLRVPYRGRLPFPALRLRRADARGPRAHRQGRAGRV